MSNSKNSLETLMTGHPLGSFDRRRKVTEENKEDIRLRHKRGEGIREIARAYEGICSRRLIQFILFPERLTEMQERDKKNEHWKKYHKREKLTVAVRNWRKYKKGLFKNGKI